MKRLAIFKFRYNFILIILAGIFTLQCFGKYSWAQDEKQSTTGSAWETFTSTVQEESSNEASGQINEPNKITNQKIIKKLWLANLNDPLKRRLGVILASDLNPATLQLLLTIIKLAEVKEGGSACVDPRNPDSCNHLKVSEILAIQEMFCEELMTQVGRPVPDGVNGGGMEDPCRLNFADEGGLPPPQDGAIDYEGGTAPIDLSKLREKDPEKDKLGPLIQYTEDDDFWLKRKRLADLISQGGTLFGGVDPRLTQDGDGEDDEGCPDTDNDGYCDDTECIDSDNDGYCSEDECIDLNENNVCDDEENTNDGEGDNSDGGEVDCDHHQVVGTWDCGGCTEVAVDRGDSCGAGISFGGFHYVTKSRTRNCSQMIQDACGKNIDVNWRTESCSPTQVIEPCTNYTDYLPGFGKPGFNQ